MSSTAWPTEDFIPTRYSLLSRLQDWEDQASWQDFFNTYWRLIYAVALKSGLTDAEAQDVVQETILSVAKNIQKFKHDPALGSFKGWLRNLARWRITDQLRKRTRSEALPANVADDGAHGHEGHAAEAQNPADLEAVWEDEWRTNLIRVALENVKRTVKEEHYQIFDLYVIKQWPADQVARTLEVNIGKIYLIKYRVGALVKKEIRRLETRETGST